MFLSKHIIWEIDDKKNVGPFSFAYKNKKNCYFEVLRLHGEELKTSVCENDGLKEKMKLIIYDDHDRGDDFTIIGEAKVSEVWEFYSLANLLKKPDSGTNEAEKITDCKVITR